MGLGTFKQGGNITYLNVKNYNKNAVLWQKTKQDDIRAVEREYEDKDGEKQVAYGVPFPDVTGLIKNLNFKQGEFGEEFVITMSDNGESFQINIGISPIKGSLYFKSFCSKLKNIDFSKEITLKPYDFITKEGKKQTGFTVKQDGNKIGNSYYDTNTKKVLVKNYPTIENWSESTKEDIEMYNIQLKSFYKKEVSKLKFPELTPQSSKKEEVKSDDGLPF